LVWFMLACFFTATSLECGDLRNVPFKY
jgi:hypothetical protein